MMTAIEFCQMILQEYILKNIFSSAFILSYLLFLKVSQQ